MHTSLMTAVVLSTTVVKVNYFIKCCPSTGEGILPRRGIGNQKNISENLKTATFYSGEFIQSLNFFREVKEKLNGLGESDN